jgi:O-antigen/teichoic acid export membrane protein
LDNSLKNKTVKGVGWSFADNIVSLGISFLVGLVLARLLTPGEYGLIGLITVFIAVFNSIVDSGFSNALIRKNDANNVDYNTVFIVNMVLSIALFSLLFISAPAISRFFDEPQLVSLSRVMGSIVVINAFAIIQRTILVKRVDFKTQTKISLISSITSGVIGIGMAIQGFG